MVAALSAFNRQAAFATVLPAIFFGGLDEGCCFGVIGTLFLVWVVFAVALGADLSIALWAFAVNPFASFVDFDVLRLDPRTTALMGAIKSVFSGPLRIFCVPELPEIALVQVHSDFGLDRFITATLGRHMLTIGDAEIEDPFEA